MLLADRRFDPSSDVGELTYAGILSVPETFGHVIEVVYVSSGKRSI